MKKALIIAKQHGLVQYLESSGTARNTETDRTDRTDRTDMTDMTDRTDKSAPTSVATSVAIPAQTAVEATKLSVVKKTLGRTSSKTLKRKTPRRR